MKIKFIIKCVLIIVCNLNAVLCQLYNRLHLTETHAGYYDIFYPGYQNDYPKPEHYRGPVPFGLPLGGFAKNGQPYGLTAYLVRRNYY
jgi:hypothetical protein